MDVDSRGNVCYLIESTFFQKLTCHFDSTQVTTETLHIVSWGFPNFMMMAQVVFVFLDFLAFADIGD